MSLDCSFLSCLFLMDVGFLPAGQAAAQDLRTLNSARPTALKSSPRKDACGLQCWPHSLREVTVQRVKENCHVENMLYLYNKKINIVEFHLFTLTCHLSHLNSAFYSVYTEACHKSKVKLVAVFFLGVLNKSVQALQWMRASVKVPDLFISLLVVKRRNLQSLLPICRT